jgi:hypothetical protein
MASTTTVVKFQLRRDTAANWNSSAVPLLEGEPGFDTTNNVLKIGPAGGPVGWNSIRPVGTSVDPVALGYQAGYSSQGTGAVAIGYEAGYTGQHDKSVAIGYDAGKTNQQSEAIAIGHQAGEIKQQARAIAIGKSAGYTGQQNDSVSIGYAAGETNQQQYAIGIGLGAGNNTQGESAVAIGTQCGGITQQQNAVAIGYFAGNDTQGTSSVAIGDNAGYYHQGNNSVAIGTQAGYTGQQDYAIAVGYQAGYTGQSSGAVAIGLAAGNTDQSNGAVAIGPNSGRYSQYPNAVAIGANAGTTGQGESAVAIGNQAGNLNQHDNTIIISALGTDLNSSAVGSCYIAPIRTETTTTGLNGLYYNTSTNEIVNSSSGFQAYVPILYYLPSWNYANLPIDQSSINTILATFTVPIGMAGTWHVGLNATLGSSGTICDFYLRWFLNGLEYGNYVAIPNTPTGYTYTITPEITASGLDVGDTFGIGYYCTAIPPGGSNINITMDYAECWLIYPGQPTAYFPGTTFP